MAASPGQRCLLQPADIGADRGVAGLDAAVIGVHTARGGCLGPGRIIEKQTHIVMQRALVALQCERVVAALIDDLLGDIALAVQRVGGHDRAFERQHRQQLGHCGGFVGFGVGGDLRQHQALLATPSTDHVQGQLAEGAIERAPDDRAVYGHNTLILLCKTRHEALERGPERLRIKLAEQAAERVMARQPALQSEEAAQERRLRRGEQRQVHTALSATQNRAQRDHQQLMEIVQRRVPRPRVVHAFPASGKLIQNILPARVSNANR